MRKIAIASIPCTIVIAIAIIAIAYFQSSSNTIPEELSANTTIIQVVNTRNLAGNDVGDKINAADTMCGVKLCEIHVSESGLISSTVYLSDNRIVAFDTGKYVVSAQIFVGNDNEIYGQGMNSTIFKRDPAWFEGKGSDETTSPRGDLNQIVDADMFKVANKNSVILHDFSIDGSTDEIGFIPIEGTMPLPTGKIFPYPKGKQIEIDLTDSQNVILHNLKILQVQRAAIDAKGTENTIIESCDISSNGYNRAVLVYTGTPSRTTTNLKVLNNYIHEGSHAGLFLQNVNGGLVQGNLFDHNRVNTYFTGSGGQINILPDSHDIKVFNNTIINAGYTPASEMPKRSTSVTGNGIELHGYDLEIIGNIIRNNAGAGISVNDNTILNAAQPHDIIIKDNKYENNGFGFTSPKDVSVRVFQGAENVQVLDAVPLITGNSAS